LQTSSALRNWLPVVAWTALIVLESAIGSSGNTGVLLYRAATWLFGHVDPVRFAAFHHIFRKTCHFFGYGILAYLCLRAFSATLLTANRPKCIALAITCTFVVACIDELHQSFSPARTGQFSDVVLDTCGAITLITVAMLVRRPAPSALER
jgi:VanZ family protein